jgi:hypothetical protein
MEGAERRVLFAQPALGTPEGVEPNLLNPNMNALADGIVIAALTTTALAVLVRVHFWVFVQKQLKGRLEAGARNSALSWVLWMLTRRTHKSW